MRIEKQLISKDNKEFCKTTLLTELQSFPIADFKFKIADSLIFMSKQLNSTYLNKRNNQKIKSSPYSHS